MHLFKLSYVRWFRCQHEAFPATKPGWIKGSSARPLSTPSPPVPTSCRASNCLLLLSALLSGWRVATKHILEKKPALFALEDQDLSLPHTRTNTRTHACSILRLSRGKWACEFGSQGKSVGGEKKSWAICQLLLTFVCRSSKLLSGSFFLSPLKWLGKTKSEKYVYYLYSMSAVFTLKTPPSLNFYFSPSVVNRTFKLPLLLPPLLWSVRLLQSVYFLFILAFWKITSKLD